MYVYMYIRIDEELNEVIVAVRGTLSIEDTITDNLCKPEEVYK